MADKRALDEPLAQLGLSMRVLRSFVPVVRPGRLKECAVPAPSVGIALSERRIAVNFDSVLPRSQEETSEFIEEVSALPGEPNDPTFFCPTRPAKGLGGGDTHSALTFSVDRIFSDLGTKTTDRPSVIHSD